MSKKLWIMIAGPYSSGAKIQSQKDDNLSLMNKKALKVLEKGHIPIIGVNVALPLIDLAGQGRFDEIMMPVSLELAKRCDAILRVGGPSKGADDEVRIVQENGGQLFNSINEIPTADS